MPLTKHFYDYSFQLSVTFSVIELSWHIDDERLECVNFQIQVQNNVQ